MKNKLESIRTRLDSIDRSIVEALAQRQQVVKEVAELKDSVSKGKGIVAALVFIGSIATAIIGYFSFK